ncbi:hypothetical protein QBC41DRAFT_353676 [Cercophora samala]|uniref:Uncharacterized protein n=1 Tax=Cercophora samala TaxID=330535 RepID=A0AA39ZJP7_9PEZI|nr:hypothetical protein QBC41DRAFT_353676 [Cercophora samala]
MQIRTRRALASPSAHSNLARSTVSGRTWAQMASFIRRQGTEPRCRLCLPHLGTVTGWARAGIASSSLPSRSTWERTLLKTCSNGQQMYRNEEEAHRFDNYFCPEDRLRHINPNLDILPDRREAVGAASRMVEPGSNISETEYDNCDGSRHLWQALKAFEHIPEDHRRLLQPAQLLFDRPIRLHPTKEVDFRFVHWNGEIDYHTGVNHMAVFTGSWPIPSPGSAAGGTTLFSYRVVWNLGQTGRFILPVGQEMVGHNRKDRPVDQDRADLWAVVCALSCRPFVEETCFPTKLKRVPWLMTEHNNMIKWWMDGWEGVEHLSFLLGTYAMHACKVYIWCVPFDQNIANPPAGWKAPVPGQKGTEAEKAEMEEREEEEPRQEPEEAGQKAEEAEVVEEAEEAAKSMLDVESDDGSEDDEESEEEDNATCNKKKKKNKGKKGKKGNKKKGNNKKKRR